MSNWIHCKVCDQWKRSIRKDEDLDISGKCDDCWIAHMETLKKETSNAMKVGESNDKT